jgi:hypothetical protein
MNRSSMSDSEQARAIIRMRKAFALLSDTGNAGTKKLYKGSGTGYQEETPISPFHF